MMNIFDVFLTSPPTRKEVKELTDPSSKWSMEALLIYFERYPRDERLEIEGKDNAYFVGILTHWKWVHGCKLAYLVLTQILVSIAFLLFCVEMYLVFTAPNLSHTDRDVMCILPFLIIGLGIASILFFKTSCAWQSRCEKVDPQVFQACRDLWVLILSAGYTKTMWGHASADEKILAVYSSRRADKIKEFLKEIEMARLRSKDSDQRRSFREIFQAVERAAFLFGINDGLLPKELDEIRTSAILQVANGQGDYLLDHHRKSIEVNRKVAEALGEALTD